MTNPPVTTDAMDDPVANGRPELHRSIGPFQMTFYGLGSMLGSGIYGLIGQARRGR